MYTSKLIILQCNKNNSSYLDIAQFYIHLCTQIQMRESVLDKTNICYALFGKVYSRII